MMHPQVHSRKINMFYILDGVRERIEYNNKVYNVLNTEISFSESEIINEINNHTERFSPNALLRPVYQEYLLPNLSYVGGGSEIAYWLQLKDYFDYLNIPFPVLTLRSSVLLISSKQHNKCKKLNLSIDDLFKDLNELAIGSGFGMRYNLGYFILRLDAGFKTYNPVLENKDRWFTDFNLKKAVFNIGLNYPF